MGCTPEGLAAALEIVPNGVSNVFVVPPAASPGTLIASRVEQGYDQVSGFMIASAPSVPPGATGLLHIQQAQDGVAWDYENVFPVVDGGCPIAFDIVVLSRYVRFTFEPLGGATMTVRLSGNLRTT